MGGGYAGLSIAVDHCGVIAYPADGGRLAQGSRFGNAVEQSDRPQVGNIGAFG